MKNAILAIFGLAALSGCETLQRQAAVHPMHILDAKADFCVEMRDKYKAKNSDIYKSTFTDYCTAQFAISGADGDNSLSSRDYFIHLVTVADKVCVKEFRDLSANQRTVNMALGTASTALSGAATVVTGGLADTILSATSTFAGASRDAANAELYRTTRPSDIIRLVQARRQILLNQMLNKFDDQRSNERAISIVEALQMANEFHRSCSLYNGLALITEAVDEKATELETKANFERSDKGAQDNNFPGENLDPM
ncbi:hypothetical protein KCG44_06765 [Pacificimonas sp. WHA3]|uniref:Lipoprotein n=1 Tax=Pacificimonas pallii TaxID=2827236 RepID=A0ABS6SF49_9SPHN|nr:hypothetical protein [Pacificimonas pallii]MBV7256487.1 hypothetical protein [Pacificimonas pallii]